MFPSNRRFPHRMAKFVLAGKADCPYYAKAELLADALQRSLPNFKAHKISILPGEWEEWLDATCKRNGWKHESSPLVWRELVEQGGKGMLLGGFSDFLEHCTDYYGITSDMPTEMMLKIAAENLETQMSLTEEEMHQLSLIQPLHIWITGALSLTSHILIPCLLSAEMFPKVAAISLHLLELKGDGEELEELKRETEDQALAMLHKVTVHTGLDQAFQEADVILLLDDFTTNRENESDEEQTQRVRREISERYRQYAQLIDTRANKQVKVIVSGNSFINLRCLLLVDGTSSIDSHQFVALATQLENEARAIIADKMKTSQTSSCGETSAAFSTLTSRGRGFSTMMGQSKDRLSFPNQSTRFFRTGSGWKQNFNTWCVAGVQQWLQ
ncbi:putative malate dehydrogenase 1B isoform X2 [Melanotaenia boesemani]|uniref:putative malate dehydrogenase 1B isoform X2 n=1 Tax=Melanotaenia boesemani TaxID=1250792 RepID=UPI001C052891|nr:putative malate dehydrogenase 1B isoform X2 [Melanotaenia boesemani]